MTHLKNTDSLSVNFVVSENRVTLMVPLNKLALTTGQRNPYGWKSENDPALTEQQYKTMGYLHYIVERLNPSLLNSPLRLHKEFMATSCSGVDRDKVRLYAEKFRTGALDPKTGQPPKVDPPVVVPDPEPDPDTVAVPREIIKGLAKDFGELETYFDGLVK